MFQSQTYIIVYSILWYTIVQFICACLFISARNALYLDELRMMESGPKGFRSKDSHACLHWKSSVTGQLHNLTCINPVSQLLTFQNFCLTIGCQSLLNNKDLFKAQPKYANLFTTINFLPRGIHMYNLRASESYELCK